MPRPLTGRPIGRPSKNIAPVLAAVANAGEAGISTADLRRSLPEIESGCCRGTVLRLTKSGALQLVKLNKSGNRRGRCLGETGLLAAELIHAAGAEGLSTMQMRELLADRTPAARRTVMIAAQRGKFIKRSFRQLCVYYAPTVAPDTIERDFEQRKDDYLRAQVAIKAAANKRWYDAARHSTEVRKAAQLDSKARRELAAQQRKATRAASATRRAEFELTNRWAEKLRGTTCGIVQVPEKPAPTVDYSRAVITVAPRKLGRYEVADTIGPFSSTKPGQYVFPANGCAAKAAASEWEPRK